MTKRHAAAELAAASKTRRLLSGLGAAQRFFVVPLPISCTPSALQGETAVEYDASCSRTPAGKSALQVNANLDNLALVFSKNAGVELAVFWTKKWPALPDNAKSATCSKVCRALSLLLMKGLHPLNREGIVHLDVKPENVVVDFRSKRYGTIARIIDWGLAAPVRRAMATVELMRSYMYNMPPSQWLFAVDDVSSALEDAAGDEEYHLERCFRASELLYDRMISEDAGHITTIDQFVRACREDMDARSFIVAYNAEVLARYAGREKPYYTETMAKLFYDDVFSKNVDIWGLLMCLGDLAVSVTSGAKPFVLGAQEVLVKLCFSNRYAVRPYPVRLVADSIRDIGSLTAT